MGADRRLLLGARARILLVVGSAARGAAARGALPQECRDAPVAPAAADEPTIPDAEGRAPRALLNALDEPDAQLWAQLELIIAVIARLDGLPAWPVLLRPSSTLRRGPSHAPLRAASPPSTASPSSRPRAGCCRTASNSSRSRPSCCRDYSRSASRGRARSSSSSRRWRRRQQPRGSRHRHHRRWPRMARRRRAARPAAAAVAERASGCSNRRSRSQSSSGSYYSTAGRICKPP